MQIPVVRNVLEANEKMAAHVRARLNDRGILALNLISSPGAGKTTLLGCLMAEAPEGVGMLFVPQELGKDQAEAALAALREAPRSERGRVLSIVAQLNSDPDRLMDGGEASPGELRKLLLAQGILRRPALIAMDEPTTYLDIGQQVKLAGIVRRLSGEGKTIVLVLHDILLALKISHRIAAVAEGEIVWGGTPEEMLAQKVAERLYGVAVGAARTETGMQYYYEIRD